MCMSGSPIFSTMVLSSSVSAPLDLQLDLLAQLLGHVAHDALEPAEGLADLHHAQAQGAVADLLHQPRQGGGGFHQGGHADAPGQQLAPAPAMTSSPTRLISSSSLSACTRRYRLSLLLLTLIWVCLSRAACTTSWITEP